LLAGIAVVAGIFAAQLYLERQALLSNIGGWHVVTRISGVVQVMEETPRIARTATLNAFQGTGFRVSWSEQSPLEERPLMWEGRLIRDALQSQLGKIESGALRIGVGTLAVRNPMEGMGRLMHRPDDFPRRAMVISLRLKDGSWLSFATPPAPHASLWGMQFFWAGALALLVVVVVSVWAVRRATQPLDLFTRAAERLGLDFNAQPLSESGPREVQRAAKAFNLMQRRLQTFVRNRTHMLAAISHDLRTPITRLKLRAEFVGDEEQRQKMLADLDEMEAMIAATLQFARDDVMGEPAEMLDLAALVRECADLEKVRCDVPDALPFTGRPLGLKRMVNNLLGNALRYADGAEVELQATPEGVVLSVRDNGPGIPDALLARVFDPFVRVEGSRSRETGGVGLGLAAVRSIAQAHGGDVMLNNRPDGGLEARVTLPRMG
ncbi:MAG TPA: ATP-binding protein, partial [Magnetovibrio sp.]